MISYFSINGLGWVDYKLIAIFTQGSSPGPDDFLKVRSPSELLPYHHTHSHPAIPKNFHGYEVPTTWWSLVETISWEAWMAMQLPSIFVQCILKNSNNSFYLIFLIALSHRPKNDVSQEFAILWSSNNSTGSCGSSVSLGL
jgi:hypothetical protein